MNKNDVALDTAKRLKRVGDTLSIAFHEWKGKPMSPHEPSANDQCVILAAAESLSNIKETLALATGKRTLFKAALMSINECYLDESSTKADVEESIASIGAAIDTLRGKI